MKLSDIMRDIADLIDQKMSRGAEDGGATNSHLTPVQPPEPEMQDEPMMIPPLQAKLEILKKSEGIPNVYDKENDESDVELAVIKKNAGLTAAQHEAADDEPLDN